VQIPGVVLGEHKPEGVHGRESVCAKQRSAKTEMQIEFYDVGATAPQNVPISLARLATFLVTDWIPTRPAELAAGFTPLLARALQDNSGRWMANDGIKSFEKQWRQVTSWMIGVAFTRDTVERLQYPFIAPVSAFTGGLSGPSTATPQWANFYARLESRIEKPTPPLSRLFPDYVVGRFDPATNSRAIAFVESKASRGTEALGTQAPDQWYRQARNAEFWWGDRLVAPERNLVVATRVNPWAVRKPTRRVVVRAWNSEAQVEPPAWDVMRELILAHYYGLFQSLGLSGFCEILESAFGELSPAEWQRPIQEAASEQLELHRVAPTNREVRLRRRAEAFELGGVRLRVGLEPTIGDGLQRLLDPDPEQAVRGFAEWQSRVSRERQQRGLDSENVVSKLDGVVAFTERR
jgi:hypothetical protein